MSYEYETVAWIHGKHGCSQTDVIVCYEIDDDNRPEIGDILEAADHENVLNSLLVENEESIIYSKLETHIFETMTDAAEMMADMER